MKIKYTPIIFNPYAFSKLPPDIIVNPETVVKQVSKDTISFDSDEITLPKGVSTFPDIREQTAVKDIDGNTLFSRITEAHWTDGELYITAPRFYVSEFASWYTGEYQTLEVEE